MAEELNINKAIGAINWIFKVNSDKTSKPYASKFPDPKVNPSILMNILFEADYLSFEARNCTITGDRYLATSDGAIPDSIYHELILPENNPLKKRLFKLDYKYRVEGDGNIRNNSESNIAELSEEDKKYLNEAIEVYITLSREEGQKKVMDNLLWKKACEKGPNSVISFNDVNEKEKTTE